jgi:hypothetical protein
MGFVRQVVTFGVLNNLLSERSYGREFLLDIKTMLENEKTN